VAHRLERLNSMLRQELSDLLRREVKDPRLSSGMISITEVDIAPDLKYAQVFVSSLGGVDEKDQVLESLRRAGGFLRSELADNLRLRYTPELDFRWDDRIEHGAHILELIDKVNRPVEPVQAEVKPKARSTRTKKA
jgi:ribosome-binding factor A